MTSFKENEWVEATEVKDQKGNRKIVFDVDSLHELSWAGPYALEFVSDCEGFEAKWTI